MVEQFDDTLVRSLEQKLDRRSFLRGSSLFAAALGLGLASPLASLALEQDAQKQDEKKKKEGEAKKEEAKPERNEGPDAPADPFAEEEDATRTTRVDKDGREFRSCPQCGANMYRQGRTWTCENCGYSYVE